jgi:hypothetical protein
METGANHSWKKYVETMVRLPNTEEKAAKVKDKSYVMLIYPTPSLTKFDSCVLTFLLNNQ